MYCPKCSQTQVSAETQFCSRCGLPLNSLKEFISADGETKVDQVKASAVELSPRQRGIRQGAMVMLLSVILIPAYILLAPLFPAHDRLIESSASDTPFEKISQAVLITILMLGLVRVLYARFFQQGVDQEKGKSEIDELGGSAARYSLPAAHSIPVSGFGTWQRQTGEMAQSPVGAPAGAEHTSGSLETKT
jgi:hypothetical protein